MKWVTVAATAASVLSSAIGGALLAPGAASADPIPTYTGSELQPVFTTEKIAPGVVLHHIVTEQSPKAWSVAGMTPPATLQHGDMQALVVDLSTPGVSVGPMMAPTLTTRETLSAMAARHGAIGAVNGEFFNIESTYAPDLNLVMDGRVVNTPGSGHATDGVDPACGICWPEHDLSQTADGSFQIDFHLPFSGTVSVNAGRSDARTFRLDGVNANSVFAHEPNPAPAGASGIFQYTPLWGSYSRSFTLNGAPGAVEVVVGADGRVTAVNAGITSTPIPDGGFVLEGVGTGATDLAGVAVGDVVTAQGSIALPDGQTPRWTFGAYLQMIKDGTPVNLTASSNVGAYPATVIGYSKDSRKMILLVCNGKGVSPDAPGMSATEIVKVMQQLGAYNAIMSDGGGSSELVARSAGDAAPTVRNYPSDGTERPNSTGFGVFYATPGDDPAAFLIDPVASNPDDDGLAVGNALTKTAFPASLNGKPASNDGATPSVFAGGHLQLAAKAVSASWGRAASSPPATAWSATAGSITGSGMLTAPKTPGATVTVTARNGSISGSQAVRVIGRIASISGPTSPLTFAGAGSPAQIVRLVARDKDGDAAPLDVLDTSVRYGSGVVSVARRQDGALEVTPLADGATTLSVSANGANFLVPVVVGSGTATRVAGPLPQDPALARVDTTTGGADPAAGDWRFGAVAGSHVATAGDAGSVQLTAAVQRARAAGEDLLFVDGGLTAAGTATQIETAADVLKAAGCSIVTTDPSPHPATDAIPCVVLPGQTDAAGQSAFAKAFGDPFRLFQRNGTAFLTLDSSAGSVTGSNLAQLDGVVAAVETAIADASVKRLVVVTARPTLDAPNAPGTGMTGVLDAAALNRHLAQVARAGKQVMLVTGDAQTASITRNGGVVGVALPALAGDSPAPAQLGGYDGQATFELSNGTAGKLTVDLQPSVAGALLKGTTDALSVGGSTHVTGIYTLTNGAPLPAGIDNSPQWAGGRGMAIGTGAAAVAAATAAGDVAIFDPATGQVTGLNPGTATLTLQGHDASGSSAPVASTTRSFTVSLAAAPAGAPTSAAAVPAVPELSVTPTLDSVIEAFTAGQAPRAAGSNRRAAAAAAPTLVSTAYRGRALRLALKVPGAGGVSVTATTTVRGRTVLLGSSSARVDRARAVSLSVHLTKRRATRLAHGAGTVTLRLSYRTATGVTSTVTKTRTVAAATHRSRR